MKRIRFTRHAKEQSEERGASEAEVKEAIRKGSREPAKHGREMCRYNLPYGRTWQGKVYPIEQVAPIIREDAKEKLSLPFTRFTFNGAHDENQLRPRN